MYLGYMENNNENKLSVWRTPNKRLFVVLRLLFTRTLFALHIEVIFGRPTFLEESMKCFNVLTFSAEGKNSRRHL